MRKSRALNPETFVLDAGGLGFGTPFFSAFRNGMLHADLALDLQVYIYIYMYIYIYKLYVYSKCMMVYEK